VAVNKTVHWVRRHPWRASMALLLSTVLLLDQLFPPLIPKDGPGLMVVARDGSPLRAWPDTDGVWRFPTTPAKVAPRYLDALLTYEDRWFYWHPGINPIAMLRAAWQWSVNGRIVSGGSTLTMQVARALEPVPRSLRGKLRQVARALQLEARLSKQEILTLYLNHAPMGGIVEGVEMASRSYLGKSANQLSPAEAALLVVLPQAPSRLRPDRHPHLAQQARDKVLRRMAQLQHWRQADVDDALIEQVGANPPRLAWLAPLAAERLHQAAHGQATVVRSTLDRDMQVTLERMLADRVAQLPRFVSMAALVMDSRSMEILAYAGSADFQDARRFSHVDMVRGIRSPGSTLKPFLYAMALDDGIVHSESLLADTPQSFGGYDPGNFQASFSGPVSVSEALQRSLNVPAVDLLALDRRAGAVRGPPVQCRPAPAVAERREPEPVHHPGWRRHQPGGTGGCVPVAGDGRDGRHAAHHPRRTRARSAHDERRRRLHRPQHSGGRRPPRSTVRGERHERRAAGLEDGHQLRLSRCVGGGRGRAVHDGRLDWPSGRHAEPRLFWREHCGAAAAANRAGHAARCSGAAHPAGRSHQRHDLLAAGHRGGNHAASALPRQPQRLDLAWHHPADLAGPPARPQFAGDSVVRSGERLAHDACMQSGGASARSGALAVAAGSVAARCPAPAAWSGAVVA
jgi:hypothetical protein